MTEIIKCVFMDRLYGMRPEDVIVTDDAYWMEDELIINSFYVGDTGIQYSANRIIEMKLEGTPNVRIATPVSGKVVGKMMVDNFRNVTMFAIET